MPGQDLRVATTSRSMPSLESLAPVLDEKPTGFLDMPRELRDKVYTYLLSTEYNKYYTEEPPLVSSIMKSKPATAFWLITLRSL